MKDNSYEARIGRKVLQNQARNRQEAVEKHDDWLLEAQILREARLALQISVKTLSEALGVSHGVVERFEAGRRIKRRKMFMHAYETYLKCIALIHVQTVEGLRRVSVKKE